MPRCSPPNACSQALAAQSMNAGESVMVRKEEGDFEDRIPKYHVGEEEEEDVEQRLSSLGCWELFQDHCRMWKHFWGGLSVLCFLLSQTGSLSV